MASGKGSAYMNNFLTWALTTTAVTRPTSWTIALYTDATGLNTPPTTEATTTNCAGYARQSASFGVATNGSISNSNDIAFTSTASGAWATINYFAVLDQSGAIVYWAAMAVSRTLQVNGDKLDFAAGSITINEK